MNEMCKLISLLENACIPYAIRPHWSGTVQVCYPNAEDIVCDVVCFPGSYSYSDGLLEIMGLVDEEEIGDSVEGWLSADEVFARMLKHYRTH